MATSNYPFLDEVYVFVNNSLNTVSYGINQIPGSDLVLWYIKSSYQHDPVRSFVELLLLLFAIRYVLSPRQSSEKNIVQFTEKEVDELVDDWQPEAMVERLTSDQERDLECVPTIQGPALPKCKLESGQTVMNLASYNFSNLNGNDYLTERVLQTIRAYGVGACGPPGFYGTQDLHMKLEQDITSFLGARACITYAQAYQTLGSVIPAFAKRGDILVVDKGANFAIQKGINLSRSNVRYFEHNDMDHLEKVCADIHNEHLRSKRPLTRRFIITEGLFEAYGDIVDLPRIIEIKKKYKFRLILDENLSFSVLGKSGRGLTEYYNIPATEVDMLVGSLSTSYCSAGGFCCGNVELVDHQRTTGLGYVFSCITAPAQAVIASEAIAMVKAGPQGGNLYSQLLEFTHTFRALIDKVDTVTTTSHINSPMIHLRLAPATLEKLGHPTFQEQEVILQSIVQEAMNQGVLVTRAKRIASDQPHLIQPSIRVNVTIGLSRKELERATNVIRSAIQRTLKNRRAASK